MCITKKLAEAGVVCVFLAAQCLKAFMIFERRSWRSNIGFKRPTSDATDVTVRNVERSNKMTSSASIFSAKACRNRSMTERFGISLWTIPAHALYKDWSHILLPNVSIVKGPDLARMSEERSSYIRCRCSVWIKSSL